MKAEETKVNHLMDSARQLRVPVWQRRYAWDHDVLKEFWADIERVMTGQIVNHFIGSIVVEKLSWDGLPSTVQPFLVIDGQQRIATISILFVAIRDRKVSFKESLSDKEKVRSNFTKEFLVNAEADEESLNRLVMHNEDQEFLNRLIEGQEDGTDQNLVIKSYNFFRDKLDGLNESELDQLIGKIRNQLDLVWVTLTPEDNAHRVFQTLNASGKPLMQSDLIRNYFFLLLGQTGDDFYFDYWEKMESQLDQEDIKNFFVAWTTAMGNAGSEHYLFSYFQKELGPIENNPESVLEYGRQLTSASEIFLLIQNPTKDSLRIWLNKQRLSSTDSALLQILEDLKRWGTRPLRGLILYLLMKVESSELEIQDATRSLKIILSFMARRILAGHQPNLHTSIFRQITHTIKDKSEYLASADYPEFLKLLLSMGTVRREWPTNTSLQQQGPSTPLYTNARAKWAFYILEGINRESYGESGNAPRNLDHSDWSVEHIMPQGGSSGLPTKWRNYLSDCGEKEPDELWATHRNYIGNLTLTKINSTLGTKIYSSSETAKGKQALLVDNGLPINTQLQSYSKWNAVAIDDRGIKLCELAARALEGPLTKVAIINSPLFGLLTEAQQKDLEADTDEDVDDDGEQVDGE